MGKLIMIMFAGLASIQLIKPLGWPGLKHRKDAWKLAVLGFVALLMVIALRSIFEPAPP